MKEGALARAAGREKEGQGLEHAGAAHQAWERHRDVKDPATSASGEHGLRHVREREAADRRDRPREPRRDHGRDGSEASRNVTVTVMITDVGTPLMSVGV